MIHNHYVVCLESDIKTLSGDYVALWTMWIMWTMIYYSLIMFVKLFVFVIF